MPGRPCTKAMRPSRFGCPCRYGANVFRFRPGTIIRNTNLPRAAESVGHWPARAAASRVGCWPRTSSGVMTRSRPRMPAMDASISEKARASKGCTGVAPVTAVVKLENFGSSSTNTGVWPGLASDQLRSCCRHRRKVGQLLRKSTSTMCSVFNPGSRNAASCNGSRSCTPCARSRRYGSGSLKRPPSWSTFKSSSTLRRPDRSCVSRVGKRYSSAGCRPPSKACGCSSAKACRICSGICFIMPSMTGFNSGSITVNTRASAGWL
ncbi:hypothetical protein D3C72_1477590 [compost metagenome]